MTPPNSLVSYTLGCTDVIKIITTTTCTITYTITYFIIFVIILLSNFIKSNRQIDTLMRPYPILAVLDAKTFYNFLLTPCLI